MTRLQPRQLPVAAKLQEVIRSRGLDDLPDTQLLHRFSHYADHPAFDVLLRRHGPLIMGVCRRILANAADAEDAFQATFLILVRKARSIRHANHLGPWLYGVACRVALKVRARAGRLSTRHTEITDMFPDPAEPIEVPDWLPLLDTELNALPAKYRDPLLLCELQGSSRADAARVLKIPEGTLSSRLARGRVLLRNRLLKHGTLLPAGGLAVFLGGSGTGRAVVSSSLFTRTGELAAILATGSKAAGVVPVETAILMDEVIKAMFLTKLRAMGCGILAAIVVTAGLLAAAPTETPVLPQEKKQGAKSASAATPSAAVEKPTPGRPRPDKDAIQGLWVVDQVLAEDGAHLKEGTGSRMLVVGDVCWSWKAGDLSNSPNQMRIRLDPTKNPKWLDSLVPTEKSEDTADRCIYELEGDKLQICLFVGEKSKRRPAEILVADANEQIVMKLTREKMPPPAGEKALIGSWGDSELKQYFSSVRDLEVLDGILFLRAPTQRPNLPPGEVKTDNTQWVGGRYTVDATKNPKWIDIELFTPYPEPKITKLHGTYEVVDKRLKLALGLTGKRAFRPLEFKADKDVLFFDVGPTGEIKEGMTLPFPRDLNSTPHLFPPPASKNSDTESFEPLKQALELMKARQFSEAEEEIRKLQPTLKGYQSSAAKFYVGACLTERAGDGKTKDANMLREEAKLLFREVISELARVQEKTEAQQWLYKRAQVGILKTFFYSNKPDEVLKEAQAVVDSSGETIEGIIARALIYYAYKEKGNDAAARDTFNRMKVHFERLPDTAFTAKSGEYSRAYWEKVWFGSEATKKP